MIRTITIKIKPDELATIIKDYLSKEGFEVSEKILGLIWKLFMKDLGQMNMQQKSSLVAVLIVT